ncbi:MAG: hypothetical protein HC899_27140 [Leptolyngbyaceae cyanobacterium SM1_4_3]|nr:hypothetical protein [Leptolyngbyaceae cyanobacterium SM1_4_3]
MSTSSVTLIDGSSKEASLNASLSGNLSRADSAQTGLDSNSLQNVSLNSLAYTSQTNFASAGANSGSEAPVVQRLMFKAEELKEKGILSQGFTECTFQGKVLVEGISFAKRLREKAVDLWQAELDSGKLCLLVEYPEHFTLWYEKEG